MKTEYGNGKMCGLGMIERFVTKKIESSKKRKYEPNSPQQIHNHARIKAYHEILQKVKKEMANVYLQEK